MTATGSLAAAALAVDLGSSPDVIRSRSGAILLVGPDHVIKLHEPGSAPPEALTRRLRLAAALPPLAGPSHPEPVTIETADGPRLATAWPRLRPLVAESAADVPWGVLGAVLAELHRASQVVDPAVSALLPVHGGHARLRRVATGLARVDAPSWLVGLAAEIASRVSSPAMTAIEPAIVHGDLHLGQFARDAAGRWLLIDVDDLGWGDPAYDLGRVAGLWAVGELDDGSWAGFLTGYRQAGGPGVPAEGDPWGRLDLPARAAVVTMIYGLLRDQKAGLPIHPDLVQNLLSNCHRMQHSPD